MPVLAERLADRLADLPPTVNATDLSRALGPAANSFKLWAALGKFPKPIPLGCRPLWNRDVVRASLRQLEEQA